MRALLTGGIKAILAIAALSTAAHWALRVQRDAPTPMPALASLPEPATTGSIEPRRVERSALPGSTETKAAEPRSPDFKATSIKLPDAKARQAASGLDQMHLSALIASTASERPKAVKPAPKR